MCAYNTWWFIKASRRLAFIWSQAILNQNVIADRSYLLQQRSQAAWGRSPADRDQLPVQEGGKKQGAHQALDFAQIDPGRQAFDEWIGLGVAMLVQQADDAHDDSGIHHSEGPDSRMTHRTAAAAAEPEAAAAKSAAHAAEAESEAALSSADLGCCQSPFGPLDLCEQPPKTGWLCQTQQNSNWLNSLCCHSVIGVPGQGMEQGPFAEYPSALGWDWMILKPAHW